MNLAEVLLKYDVVGKRFDSHEIVADLNALPEAERQKNECKYEIVAFRLQPNDRDHTFGGYYGPQFTLSDPQGNPVYVPEQSSITSDAVIYWERRYKSVVNPLLKMRYAGLVWDFKKQIVQASYDSDLYRTYVDSMLAVCNNDFASHPVITTIILERLFSIALKQPSDLEKAKEALRDFEKRHATDDGILFWACQFLLMMEHKNCFTQDEIDTMVRQHEARMARLAAGNSDGKIDVWTLDSQCQLLSDYYYQEKQKDEVARVMKVSEYAHKKSFDHNNPFQKLSILNDLHRKYTHYGLSDEAKRLLVEIQKAGSQTADSMTPHDYKFTIPQDVYEQAEKMFGKKASSDEDRWKNFAVYFIPRKDAEKQSLEEIVRHYPLQYMAPTQMLDAKGRPQSFIGTYESDPDGNLVMHITEKLNLGTHFLVIAIKKLVEAGLMTTDKIMSDIVVPCPLFEEDSYGTIRQAIEFLLDDKPSIFCHMLVPQLERAIRNLVEASGISVIKPQKAPNKGFQLITLDNLLRKEPVEYAFTEDGALYLRLVLTDQRSLNIRNTLCHGLLAPDTYNYGVAARLMHVLVMIGSVR